MGYAKKSYKDLVYDLYNIICSLENEMLRNSKGDIKKGGISNFIANLFLIDSDAENNKEALRHVDNKKRYFKEEYILNYVYNYIVSVENMAILLPINSEVDWDKLDRFNNKLAEKLYHYYFEVNPYPWMENNIKNLYEEKDYNKLSFNCILQLLCYSCFNVNKTKYNSKNSKIKFCDEYLASLLNDVKNNNLVIVNGFKKSGRSSLLKDFASKNKERTFFLDLQDCEADESKILNKILGLREDVSILRKIETGELKNEKFEKVAIEKANESILPIVNGLFDIELIIDLFSKDDILVVDNISDERILDILAIIPCKKVCVVNKYIRETNENFCLYEYNNKKICCQLLQQYDKNIDDETLDILYKDLGSNLYLYRFLALSDKKIKERSGKTDFIKKYIECTVDNMYDLFSKGAFKQKISYNYKGKKSGNYVDTWIEKALKYYLQPNEMIVLRILFLIQDEISDYELELMLHYLKTENIKQKLIDFGWYFNNKFRIPKLVVMSCNRVNNIHNYHQGFLLTIIWNFGNVLDGITGLPLNIKICKCLIKAIYKDILSYHPYIDKSRKVADIDKKYYGKFKKYNNRKKLTDKQKKLIDNAETLRINDIKDDKIANDPNSLYEMQFWKNPILRVFFERSLWFIYLHRNTEKFKDCSNNKDFQFFENLCEFLGNNIMDSNTFEMYKNLWGLIIGRDKSKEEDIIQLPNEFNSPENVCHFSSNRPIYELMWNYHKDEAFRLIKELCEKHMKCNKADNYCVEGESPISKIVDHFVIMNRINWGFIVEAFHSKSYKNVFELQQLINCIYETILDTLHGKDDNKNILFIQSILNSYGDKQYYLKVNSEYSLFLCVFLLFHNKVDRNCLISLYNELLYVAQQCGEVVQKNLIDSVLKYLNATF